MTLTLAQECDRLSADLGEALRLRDHYAAEAASMSRAAYLNAQTALECANQRDDLREALRRIVMLTDREMADGDGARNIANAALNPPPAQGNG